MNPNNSNNQVDPTEIAEGDLFAESDLAAEPKDIQSFEYEEKIRLLESELAKKNEEAKQNYDKYLRSLADLDNFRKRMLKEKQDVYRYGCENLIKNLLPALDNLQRALAAAKDGQDITSFVTGLKMIQDNLFVILQKEGLEPLPVIGEKFDPQLHDAVMYEESEAAEGEIIAELQTGYKLHERIIRHAMVKVAKSKEKTN